MPQIFSSVPGEPGSLVFQFNGQFALKNYNVEIINGNRLKVTSAQNELFSLLEVDVTEVEINGIIYNDANSAQIALQSLVFSDEVPVVLSTEDRAAIMAGYRGSINKSTPKPTKEGFYLCEEPGIYININNIEVLDGYLTFLILNSGSIWTSTKIKISGNGSDFVEKKFNYVLDLSKPSYAKYIELTGEVTFSEASGSKFGVPVFAKLTGGSVKFPSNFVAQFGTADYDPTKTNTIVFWKEYEKVRYFIETFPLEPLPVDGLISYYNFNGKTPNTLLSAIAPNFGAAFIGNTSGFRINSYGTQLQQIANASSGSSAIAIDVGAITNYKATLYVSLAQELEINIGTTAYNTWSDYINIQFMNNSRIQHVSPSVPAGEIIYSSSTIEYPNTRFYKWEFIVNGNSVTVYYEGNQLVTYTHGNTGSLFSIIFKNANDNFQSIKIEEL